MSLPVAYNFPMKPEVGISARAWPQLVRGDVQMVL